MDFISKKTSYYFSKRVTIGKNVDERVIDYYH
jgi:hypothetical protein